MVGIGDSILITRSKQPEKNRVPVGIHLTYKRYNEIKACNGGEDSDRISAQVLYHLGVSKRNKWLSRRVLFELNSLISHPEQDATPNKDQIYYPALHLLYHLSIAGKFLDVDTRKASKWVLRRTDRYELYKQFSTVEKYIFLLETFWVDVNWVDLDRNTG